MSLELPMSALVGRPAYVDRGEQRALTERLCGLERRIRETRGALALLESEAKLLRARLRAAT
jgi:hypothetical protein